MDQAERKARILHGQHLTDRTEQSGVCRDLLGVQAQFPASALHALAIRSDGPVEPGKLVKSWTLRGTVHVFDPADLPLFLHEGRSRRLRPVDRMVADEWITLERKQQFAQVILDRIAGGVGDREALKAACFAAGMTDTECESVFNSWGGTLRYLAETGQIVHQVDETKSFRLCPPFEPMGEEAALLEQTRRYFTHYGPATVRDAAYFFGRPQREVKTCMDRLPLSHARIDGADCFWVEDGRTDWPDIPACLFLAGFDQLMLGYEKKDGLFLPTEHLRGIFNLAGIVMAPILLRGRVAGRWKQKEGRLTITPFETWSEQERKQILSAAEGQWTLKKVVWE